MPAIYVVDAFTDKAFSGNPAAVCPLDGPADEGWMRSVAAEMNLAETAFLWPLEGGLSLRWFTPTVEVDLCGHATLASAHVLWESGRLPRGETARFSTKSGWLTAERRGDEIALDFPARMPEPCELPADIEAILGVKPRAAAKIPTHFVLEMESEAAVRAVRPDLERIKPLAIVGAIVTGPGANGEFDCVSRFFAPQAGVDEDPVTGSAHCTLGPYWAAKLGKTQLRCYQASARGGVVNVTVKGDRVALAGSAVMTLQGNLLC